MNHFLTGFTDELTKLGAYGPQTVSPDPRSAGDVGTALKKFQGTGLKAGPMTTQPAKRVPDSPSPSTTPAHMIDVASKM